MEVEERLRCLQSLPAEEFAKQTEEAIRWLEKHKRNLEKIGINIDPPTTHTYSLILRTLEMIRDIKQSDTEKLRKILMNIDKIIVGLRTVYESDAAFALLE